MNATLDAKTIARNVWQDSARDGLMEMMLGAYFLLTGIVIQADMSALFIIFMAFFPAMAKKMKERFTYPRIGYVKFPERENSPGRWVAAALIAAVFAFAMMALFTRAEEKSSMLYKWISLGPALILAATLSFAGKKTGFMRYYAMAAFALVMGFVVPFVNLPNKMGNVALYLLVVGPVFLVWGAAIFLHFVQTVPIRAEEEAQ